MGELEQSVIHQLLVRLHPFRKFIWALCALAAMLAILIILNSVWIIASTTTMHPVGDTSFVIFSEVLAWLLLILSGVGLKMTCMANSAAKAASSSSLTRLDEESASSALPLNLLELDQRNRPFSAPNWVPAAGWPADFGDLLPGAVRADQQSPFDPFLFPPPPPRYSSLELPAPVMVISAAGGSEAAAAAGRRISQPITSRPSGSGGRGGGSFVRSPPPPYCPPPPPSRPADD